MMHPSKRVSPSDAAIPSSAEVCVNCWYVMDHQGFIFALRVMSYVCVGEESEKLAFLRSRAHLDYLVARDFPVPRETGFVDATTGETKTYAVIHHNDAALLGMASLFWPALDTVARGQQEPSRLPLPEAPVMKITALVSDQDGGWRPHDLDSEA